MHLRQPRFAHSVYRPFTKNKETIKKFKETGDSREIQNELKKLALDMILLMDISKIYPEEQLLIKY